MVYTYISWLRPGTLPEEDPRTDPKALKQELNMVELIKPVPIYLLRVNSDHIVSMRNVSGIIDLNRRKLKIINFNDYDNITNKIIKYLKQLTEITGEDIQIKNMIILKGLEGIEIKKEKIKYDFAHVITYTLVEIKGIRQSYRNETVIPIEKKNKKCYQIYAYAYKESVEDLIQSLMADMDNEEINEEIKGLMYETMDIGVALSEKVMTKWEIKFDAEIIEKLKLALQEEKEEVQQDP